MVGERSEIDALIAASVRDWTVDRMPAVDRTVLRMATWELLYGDDVPAGVAIDEAVELGKELSTDESPAFVNGVLARRARGARGRPCRPSGHGLAPAARPFVPPVGFEPTLAVV